MARPRYYDYDPGSDEEIVTAGVEASQITWFGISVENETVHIVCQEGTINATEDDLEDVTRAGQQISLEGAAAATFYAANKTTIDTLLTAAYATWATEKGKTGSVIVA